MIPQDDWSKKIAKGIIRDALDVSFRLEQRGLSEVEFEDIARQRDKIEPLRITLFQNNLKQPRRIYYFPETPDESLDRMQGELAASVPTGEGTVSFCMESPYGTLSVSKAEARRKIREVSFGSRWRVVGETVDLLRETIDLSQAKPPVPIDGRQASKMKRLLGNQIRWLPLLVRVGKDS